MGEPKRPSRLRRALFDRPILKLFLTFLFMVIVATLARYMSMPLLRFLVALVMGTAVVYAIVLTGHIISLYLIRKPLDRLFSARDLFSLILSYVMFIVGILLVISVVFMVVEDLHLGYLTYDPTEKLSSDMVDNKDPNLSQDYLYFSAITFFSVGYGDVCPMGFCRTLAMATAFAGNVVTVVLMAIVVSLYLNRRTKAPDQSSSSQSEGNAEG
jgi:potassium channel LctB